MEYSNPQLIQVQLIQVSHNPEVYIYIYIENEKCCSQLNTYFKIHTAYRKADEPLVWSDKI
jgi:hypothetical protein